MSNGLDPDQDLHSVDPDLVPNCYKGYQPMTKIPQVGIDYMLNREGIE